MTNNLKITYLSLLKDTLLGRTYIETEAKLFYTFQAGLLKEKISLRDYYDFENFQLIADKLESCKREGNYLLLREKNSKNQLIDRHDLRNITELSHTMIGEKRMDNIQQCIETIIKDNVPGDLIETGVWRGGAIIWMLGILKANDVNDRTVWAADSFEGVPSPTLKQDIGFDLSKKFLPVLAVTQEEVRKNIRKYHLLDQNLKFLPGWFKDTLNTEEINKLAILRLDGDLYESTMDALIPLYPKVSSGGFVIVDDYESCPPCKLAINEFREQHRITEPLLRIDNHGVYWRKS